jgi:hypothetical protein
VYAELYGGVANRSAVLEAAALVQSRSGAMSVVFLAMTVALNLFAVANLALQHYYAKKSLWAVDAATGGDDDGLDTDTMIMFVKRTHHTRSYSINACISSTVAHPHP